MTQTAVGLIIIDLDNECKARGMFVNWDMYLAKEKEQIEEAHLFGLLRPLEMEATKQAEQYYNKTYNNGL